MAQQPPCLPHLRASRTAPLAARSRRLAHHLAGALPAGMGRRPDRPRAPAGEDRGRPTPHHSQTGDKHVTFLETLRTRRSRASGRGPQADTSSPAGSLPIAAYDQLNAKQIRDQLSQRSQVELAAVETYERAHESRPVVLDKLRYMHGSEPLPGYDALTTEQIA